MSPSPVWSPQHSERRRLSRRAGALWWSSEDSWERLVQTHLSSNSNLPIYSLVTLTNHWAPPTKWGKNSNCPCNCIHLLGFSKSYVQLCVQLLDTITYVCESELIRRLPCHVPAVWLLTMPLTFLAFILLSCKNGDDNRISGTVDVRIKWDAI